VASGGTVDSNEIGSSKTVDISHEHQFLLRDGRCAFEQRPAGLGSELSWPNIPIRSRKVSHTVVLW
jgi:hypothetical protein